MKTQLNRRNAVIPRKVGSLMTLQAVRPEVAPTAGWQPGSLIVNRKTVTPLIQPEDFYAHDH